MKPLVLTKYLVVYGLVHALVDAACILIILSGIGIRSDLLTYILLYNVLAFGLQLPFGWVIDKIHIPVLSAFAGCITVSSALLLFPRPIAATVLAGVGNALFHVGGGTVSLNLRPRKAAMPGVFVAPGGIGLFAGGLMAKTQFFYPYYFSIVLISMGIIILILKSPAINYEIKKIHSFNFLAVIILLLLITICIRSAVGLSMKFPWKTGLTLPLFLAVSIAFGKGIGGFLSDFFGWITITVGGLLLSALLLFFGNHIPAIGIFGIFLFNMTMPVTLVAVSNLLPGRPGFSFGLTTVALVTGAIPTFFSYKKILSNEPVSLTLILVSAVILFIALKLCNRDLSQQIIPPARFKPFINRNSSSGKSS